MTGYELKHILNNATHKLSMVYPNTTTVETIFNSVKKDGCMYRVSFTIKDKNLRGRFLKFDNVLCELTKEEYKKIFNTVLKNKIKNLF